MNEVKMRKDELKAILEKNREQHRGLFEEAHEAFRAKVIENLESRLDAAKTGQPIQLHMNLVEPQDHTTDYDRALEMLRYEVEDTVTLHEHEFAQLVQDDWGWKQQFAASYAVNTGKNLA